jgi:hypothetical protein
MAAATSKDRPRAGGGGGRGPSGPAANRGPVRFSMSASFGGFSLSEDDGNLLFALARLSRWSSDAPPKATEWARRHTVGVRRLFVCVAALAAAYYCAIVCFGSLEDSLAGTGFDVAEGVLLCALMLARYGLSAWLILISANTVLLRRLFITFEFWFLLLQMLLLVVSLPLSIALNPTVRCISLLALPLVCLTELLCSDAFLPPHHKSPLYALIPTIAMNLTCFAAAVFRWRGSIFTTETAVFITVHIAEGISFDIYPIGIVVGATFLVSVFCLKSIVALILSDDWSALTMIRIPYEITIRRERPPGQDPVGKDPRARVGGPEGTKPSKRRNGGGAFARMIGILLRRKMGRAVHAAPESQPENPREDARLIQDAPDVDPLRTTDGKHLPTPETAKWPRPASSGSVGGNVSKGENRVGNGGWMALEPLPLPHATAAAAAADAVRPKSSSGSEPLLIDDDMTDETTHRASLSHPRRPRGHWTCIVSKNLGFSLRTTSEDTLLFALLPRKAASTFVRGFRRFRAVFNGITMISAMICFVHSVLICLAVHYPGRDAVLLTLIIIGIPQFILSVVVGIRVALLLKTFRKFEFWFMNVNNILLVVSFWYSVNPDEVDVISRTYLVLIASMSALYVVFSDSNGSPKFAKVALAFTTACPAVFIVVCSLIKLGAWRGTGEAKDRETLGWIAEYW